MPAYPSKRGGLLTGTWMVDRVNMFFRFRRYIKWVAERWFILAFCVVVGVGYSTYKAVTTPDMFRATSKIGVAPRIQTPHQNPAQFQEEVSTFFDKQVQYMGSDHVLSKARQSAWDNSPKKEGFTYSTKAYKGPASLVMEVDSTDFEFARRFSVAWAHEFLDYKFQMRKTAFGKSGDEVRKEIQQQETALAAAREALAEFQNKNKIASVKETGDAAQQRLDDLQMKLQSSQLARQQLENRKPEEIAAGVDMGGAASASRTNASGDTNAVSAPVVRTTDPIAVVESQKYGDAKLKLRQFEAELELRSATLQPRHPWMLRLKQEIAQLNQQLKDVLQQIEERRLAQISSFKRDEEGLKPIIETARKEVFDSRSIQYEFGRLKEDESNVKQILDDLRKQMQAIEAAPSDEGFFNIDEEGSGSPAPVSPDRRKMILAGLTFGAVFGLGLIYLLGRLDDRLELAEDIESQLQERVLGQIPLVNKREMDGKRLLASKLEKHNMFAESLRGVRSALMFSAAEGEKKVLIVSSAAPGDGKTTVTTNLAITLATAGNRVLLVDGDLRRGNVHTYFDWEREPGFSEVLAGTLDWKQAARVTEIPTLHVITSGKLPSNPGELLITATTETFVEEARPLFDYIIFDCPPLTSIDDAFSLSGLGDGVLFVIMSGQTSMRFAKQALTAVRQRGGRILGLILNGIRPDNPYYYYQKYYYTYYTLEEPEPAVEGQTGGRGAVAGETLAGQMTGTLVKTTTTRKRQVVRGRQMPAQTETKSKAPKPAAEVSGPGQLPAVTEHPLVAPAEPPGPAADAAVPPDFNKHGSQARTDSEPETRYRGDQRSR